MIGPYLPQYRGQQLMPYGNRRNLAIGTGGVIAAAAPYAYRQFISPAAKAFYSAAKKVYNFKNRTFTAKPTTYKKGFGRVSRKRPIPKKGLKNQVKELKRLAEADTGELIYRDRATDAVLCSVNGTAHSDFVLNSTSHLEGVLAQLRYYNPSVPGTLTTADGATGSFEKEFYFTTCYGNLTCRNNYQVPVDVSIYLVKVKNDTSIIPTTAFTDGLADVGSPTSTSPLVYLTDSPIFNDLWKITNTYKFKLSPGQQKSYSASTPKFMYDPSLTDVHGLVYQRKNKTMAFIVRVEGVIGHDTTADEQGCLAAGVDVMFDRTFKVKYQAGADIKYIHVVNSASTFTNGGVVSNKPVSDNQQYSVL